MYSNNVLIPYQGLTGHYDKVTTLCSTPQSSNDRSAVVIFLFRFFFFDSNASEKLGHDLLPLVLRYNITEYAHT